MIALSQRPPGPFSVSTIGLGCMNLSHGYGVATSHGNGGALQNRALEFGVALFDTASLYGGGRNERLIGASIMHRRREFTQSSKCVLDLREGERVLRRVCGRA